MRYWVGVASREHVLLGVAGGFCQVCHGKQAPLARMKQGDWILYYSPKTGMNSGEKVQAFTAVGQIVDDRVYQFRMAENFEPFRRDVVFQDAPHPCPIEVAREHPEWRSYAKQLRYGHFEVSHDFFEHIYRYMMASKHEITPIGVRQPAIWQHAELYGIEARCGGRFIENHTTQSFVIGRQLAQTRRC